MKPSSRIPSPARSQGAKSTPRRYKPRASRSVGSPARSNTSVKLSNIIQMNSFAISPMPSRRSVLTDTTDIDIPRRQSWWKKLDENYREVIEVLNSKDPAEANNAIEEYIGVDVLSQEKQNYTIDIPESSDGESISSIVIPQRKLFTQKESKSQKKFAQIIDNRESLPTLHKTQGDDDKTFNVGRKNLFNKGTKQRTKPLFPSALLNVSTNKTVANITQDMGTTNAKAEVKNLFGNRPGIKRKNMFADFIVSDSEDEIPEIQTKVFEFQKKPEQKLRQSLNPRVDRESRLTSPTSSITDIEMDDWRLLPSSTMVDHQLEVGLGTTPSKRARLSKLPEVTESVNTANNTTTNKTKQPNKSLHSKSKSKNLSHFQDMDVNELVSPKTNVRELDVDKEKNKSSTKNNPQSSKEQTFKNKEHSKSKNVSLMKTDTEAACDIVFGDKSAKTNRKHESNKQSKIDQVLQSHDDDDFTLVYENDDDDEIENEGIMGSEAGNPKEISKHLQSESKSQNILQASQVDNGYTKKQHKDTSHNSSTRKVQSLIRKTSINKSQGVSNLHNEIEIENLVHVNQTKDNEKNSSQYNSNFVGQETQDVLNNQDKTGGYKEKHKHNSHNTGSNIRSPELILHDKPSQMESFAVQGRNTSVRKTKSIIKNITMGLSMASVRESTGFSNGSRNSSADRSGWDSHRTTRATLRQTFGKEFTPRKSLRALVMEKSAKRQTNFAETNAEISRYPQVNSTELPGSDLYAIDKSDANQKINKSDHEVLRDKSNYPRKLNKSHRELSRDVDGANDAHAVNKSVNTHKIDESNQEGSRDISDSGNALESNEVQQEEEVNEADEDQVDVSEQGPSRDIDELDDVQRNNKSIRKVTHDADDLEEINGADDAEEASQADEEMNDEIYEVENDEEIKEAQDAKEMSEAENAEEMSEDEDAEEMRQADNIEEISEVEEAEEMSEAENAEEMSEAEDDEEIRQSDNAEDNSEAESAEEVSEAENAEEMSEVEDAAEMREDDYPHEINESGHRVSYEHDEAKEISNMNESNDLQEMNEIDDVQEMNESDNAQEMNESDEVQMNESYDAQERNETDDTQEMNESDEAKVNESYDAQERNETDNAQEINVSNDAQEMNESDGAQEMNESHDAQMNDSYDAQEVNESDDIQEANQSEDALEMNSSNHEESRKTRQSTLEMYLQNIKMRNIERKKQLEDKIRNSLKPPTRDTFFPFKVPAVPKLRQVKSQQMKPKAKPIKSAVIPLNMLPVEVLEDMKYKPPKRYRPTNASWITKRLYKFLETKLEPKYDYKARVRSEKLVETIYNFTKDIRRHSTAPTDAVDSLKHEMARLEVVKTHFEFYEFFHEYMPREVRVKVVPDVFNKISLPRYGVFSDILR